MMRDSDKIKLIMCMGVGRTNLPDESSVVMRSLSKLLDYKKIGTRKMCQEWKDRCTPVSPKITRINYSCGEWSEKCKCPRCNMHLVSRDVTGLYAGRCFKYCPDCGQALEWKYDTSTDDKVVKEDGILD